MRRRKSNDVDDSMNGNEVDCETGVATQNDPSGTPKTSF